MSDNILFKFSDFYQDDGGFEKLKTEFRKTGDDLIADAKRIKGELAKALTLGDIAGLSNLESKVSSLEATFKKYGDAKKGLITLEKEHAKALQEEAKLDALLEKNKQQKIATTKKEIEAEAALNRGIQSEINTKKSVIALSEAERRASEAAAKSTGLQRGAYSMLSAELRKLFTESADVAAQMFRLEQAGQKATPEYKKLESTFNSLASRTNRLDQALKTIDSSLGRNQRNVGNYASGYNGLGNSINQLTRELPAFTYSAQTGVLALSNNIPILTDEIGRLNRANVELAAAGKPTVSVLGQVLKSVFSLQTAMGIGILLATLYAKEIGAFAKSLFGADDAMKDLTDSQIAYNNARVAGTKASLDARLELNQNLKVAKNEKLTMEERLIAYQKVIDQYPFYFKGLTQQQILAGETEAAEDKLRKAIEKRAIADKLSEAVVKDKSKIIDLQFRINGEKRLLQIVKDRGGYEGKTAAQNASDNSEREKREKNINDLMSLRTKLIFENSSREQAIVKLRSESIGLDEKIEKEKTEKTLRNQQINNVDFLASDYELKKALLESAISLNEQTFSSDKNSAEKRIDAQKLMVTQMLALVKLDKDESLRLLKNKYLEEKNETIKDSDGKIIGKKYTNNGLIELEKQYNFDVKTIREKARKEEADALEKGESIRTLELLNFQLANLKFLQSLSTNADQYNAYYLKIKDVNDKINKIINQNEGLELSDKIQINEGELKRLDEFSKKIKNAFGDADLTKLTGRQREAYLKMLKAFEDEKTRIERNAETQRQLNRLEAIKVAMTTASSEIERQKLELERQAILKKLKQDEIDIQLDGNKKILDATKKMTDEWKTLLESVLDKMIEINQKRIESNQQAVENQKTTITKQEELARAGLDNTLAFEQQQLAKREAALAKSQRKQEKLEKIKSLYSAYSNYSSKGDENPLAKALRDFAILEAIAASFGKGGIVDAETIAKQNGGIMRGPSHKSRKRGIHIMAEGQEGIFSRREMANLGKENFYKMKEMAGTGKVDTNFFTRQRKQFNMAIVPQNNREHSLESFSNEITDAIRNQPNQHWNKAEMIGDFIQIVETIMKPGGTIRNTHIIKKPRL